MGSTQKKTVFEVASVHMNTAAMSEIEPGNVWQVSTSLSIFTQPPQVCFGQTIAAGWLREQVLGGGRTLAASGWHVLACARVAPSQETTLRCVRRETLPCARARARASCVQRSVAVCERMARRHARTYGTPSRRS